MADTTLNDVLGLDLSEYTTSPYAIKNEPAEKKQVMSVADVLRGTKIGSEWKTPSIDTLTAIRDRVPTVAEDLTWSIGTNTVRGIKNIIPAGAVAAMTTPVATVAGLSAGAAGWSAGSALGASAVGSLGIAGWWGKALGDLAGVVGGIAGGLGFAAGAGGLVASVTPTETATEEYDNPLNPVYQQRMLRELDDKHTKGEITDEEYQKTKDEYLGFIKDSKRILEESTINVKEKNDVVDMLDGREYPDGNIVDSVIAWGAKALKDDQDFYDYALEQRKMNPNGFANVFGGIVGNLVPYYASAYLYRAALTTPKLKTVFKGNRFRENIVEVPTNLSREQVTEKVGALAKAYTTAQMAGEYTAENVLKYIERTGDVNLENYQPTELEGAMAGAYGAIGAITEFELGGVEPLIVGSFKKVGLKLPTVKVIAKTGGQEAYEETVQNLTQFLSGKIDDTETRTWGEFFKDTLQAAGWALVTGGTIGAMTHRINRANLVKGIVKYGNGAISEQQATQVADTMIEMVEETMDYRKNDRLEKLKSYVSAIYSDVDMPEAERADTINTIASLEYALISQWNTINGTDIADDPIFKGEVNALGWFRTGIPETQREAIDKYFAELAETEKQQKNLEGWIKKAQEANNQELVKQLGQQLDEIESKLEVLRSDKYRLDLLGDLVAEDKRAIALELRKRKQQLKAKQKAKDQNVIKELDAAIADQKAGMGSIVTLDETQTSDHDYGNVIQEDVVEESKNGVKYWFITDRNGGGRIRLLTPENKIIGQININKNGVRYLYLEPEYRSDKYGKLLWDEAQRFTNPSEVMATGREDTPVERAIGFWKKQGFKQVGETPKMTREIDKTKQLEPFPENQMSTAIFQDEVFKIADENARLDDIYPAYEGETIVVDGKERTVYNSEGKRIAKSKEALTNFWKWFGDSKVVDGRGRPLVVYHGSYEKAIEEFDKKTFGSSTGNMGMFGQGFYFTDETFIAEDYAGMGEESEEDRGKVYSVYLKIENPLVIDSTQEYGEYGNENSDAALDALKKKKLLGKDEDWTDFYAKIWEDDKPSIFLSQYAKDNGFDGIFGYYTSTYFIDHGETRAEFVAFEPTQIKSVDNRGTYSEKTGNIYYQDENPTIIDIEDIVSNYNVPEVIDLVLNQDNIWGTLIDPVKYKAALEDFVKNGQLLRTKTEDVENWFEIIVRNTQILSVITDMAGHGYNVPTYEIIDYFFNGDKTEFEKYKKELQARDEELPPEYATGDMESTGSEELSDDATAWKLLEGKGFFDKARLPDDSPAFSDFGLQPLWNIISQYKEGMSAEQVLVLINKALDVYHQNGDLASGFIKGGAEVASAISNDFPLPNILFQNRVSGAAPATYRGAYIPALRFILKANRMDASSLSHELAHDWFEVYVSHAQSGKASKEFMRSWGVLEKALGIDLTKPGSLSKASEIFARAYEAWIMDKKDWAKNIAIADKDKEELDKLFKNYQNHLRDIYNNIVNPYFQITWGKVGELKPELRDWFDRMTEIKSLEGMVERGEITQEQANQERINQAIDNVIANTEDADTKRALQNAKVLNDTSRYEAEGGNKNALQRRIATLAKAIDENNMLIKENYDTHRDMLEVAKQADNFVRTRLDDALAIINGQMAEQEGLFKEDIYTALERLALENGDLNLLDELKNSEIANRLAKELGQRVAGFRNWTAGDLDVVSTVKMLDNKFNQALKNKKAQNLLKEATEMFESAQKEQDKLADKQLESTLKELECK